MRAAISVDPERREHLRRYARGALVAADAVGRIPTPLDDVANALQLTPPHDLFDLGDATPELARRVRRLMGKVRGALDVRRRVIYIDHSQSPSQQRFVQGHEIGHDALPWHPDAYYADDNYTLNPATAAELEAEANTFSAELLFNVGAFTDRAHSTRLGMAVPLELADVFGTSRHAAIRHYVEDSPLAVGLLVLGRHHVPTNGGPAIKVLYGLESASFRDRVGLATHCMPGLLPVGQSQSVIQNAGPVAPAVIVSCRVGA